MARRKAQTCGVRPRETAGASRLASRGRLYGTRPRFSKWFRDVIAFEPNPLVATLLEANIALAGCRNVQVQRVGLGVADASLPFTPDTDGNDGKGSFAVTGQTTIPLPVLNGDKLLASLASATWQAENAKSALSNATLRVSSHPFSPA